MNPAKGYYSVIQYCPDFGRMETVNVGIILLCPNRGFLDVRLRPDNRRLRKVFGVSAVQAQSLDWAKRAMENRVRNLRAEGVLTPEALTHFARIQANALIVTDPRFMRVAEPEADLATLFQELVLDKPNQPERGASQAKARLKKMVQSPALQNKILARPTVIVPVIERAFKASCAYDNGSTNLVKLLVLSVEDAGALGKAEKLVAEASLIQRHSASAGPPQRVIVLLEVLDAETSEQAPALERKIENLFKDFDIRVVKLKDLDAFQTEIEREAHEAAASSAA